MIEDGLGYGSYWMAAVYKIEGFGKGYWGCSDGTGFSPHSSWWEQNRDGTGDGAGKGRHSFEWFTFATGRD